MTKYEKYGKEELIKHIEQLEKQLKSTKYGLNWDKSLEKETVIEHLKTSIPILTKVDTKRIFENGINHLLIEGDNFHALTSLNMLSQTLGGIDVIYIDPPYNTGNKDFVYNDDFVDFDDGYRHSKWLNFMEKRLFLSKELLSKKGVIFLSIDDNEHPQLKLLCDQVFGEKNFVADFCVVRSEGGGMAKQVVIGHDYCLVYAKNINEFVPLAKPKDVRGKIVENQGIKYWIQEDWLRKEFGKYGNCHYEELLQYKNQEFKNEIDEGLKTGKYVLLPKKYGMSIIGKLRKLDEDSSKFYSVLKHLNKDGVNSLKEMGISFDYPKPVSLIKELVWGATFFNKGATVLDFFAGSGTTGQAVLELNEQDGGNRRFILCTNNENNICTEVTYPRLKTVITGNRPDGTKYSDGIKANLHYFKCDFIPNVGNADQAKYNLVEKVNNLLCIAEDVFDLVDSSPRHYVYQSNDAHKQVFMYIDHYEENSFNIFKKKIFDSKADSKVVYMFSTDNVVDDLLFKGIKGVEIKPIPSKIYEIYKDIVEDIKRG